MKKNRVQKSVVIIFVIIITVLLLGKNIFNGFETFLIRIFPSDYVLLGKITEVKENENEIEGRIYWFQELTVEFLSGSKQGEKTLVHSRGLSGTDDRQKLKIGNTVIVAKNTDLEKDEYFITDRYRLPTLLFGFLIFSLVVIALGKMRGLTSFLGLLASIFILATIAIPRILSGGNPLTVSLFSSILIAFISLYLTHGFNMKTTIALAGTIITIVIAVIITVFFINALQLLGISTEESFVLRYQLKDINLQGILLAGIIIGMLGVLDDITISQTATVREIKKANDSLTFKALYKHGISVGREHIASLVNTLVMAYVGASLPLFLLVIIQSKEVPIWLAVNGEPIAEEIARSLIGSISLVFAVPITTFLAAYYYGKK